MPVSPPPLIKPPFWQFNGHLQTIIPAITRKPVLTHPVRERITLPDSDFLDLDWYKQDHNREGNLLIVTHGLEGNSQSPYMLGMAKTGLDIGYDVLNWNFRGCSGEPNQAKRFYHSGATEDLVSIFNHVLLLALKRAYRNIVLVGFSLGGNMCLKFAGELGLNIFPESEAINKVLKKVFVFSVPVDLSSSSDRLENLSNFIYKQRFLRSLKNKIRLKAQLYPGEFDLGLLEKVSSIRAFDEHFTAPLHGFGNAANYYVQNSSIGFIKYVKLPTWIINARNDVFLPENCFPVVECMHSEAVSLLVPEKGGHCGFATQRESYWSEEFVKAMLKA